MLTFSNQLLFLLCILFLCACSQADEYDALVYRGDVALQAGHVQRALTLWRRARELDPKDLNLLVRMGIAESIAENWGQAEELLLDVLEQQPENAKALFNLALMFYNKGEPDTAARWFSKVYRADPNYPELHFHIGLLYEKAGELQKAREFFVQELNVNPSCAKAWERLSHPGPERKDKPSPLPAFLAAVTFLVVVAAMLLYHRFRLKCDRESQRFS